MSNSELINWLKKKAETVPMPGARKMYEAAIQALEAQKDMVSRKTANVAICNACGKIDCDKMDKCEKLQLSPANCSEFPNNSDTISREAVADAINGIECTRHTTWYEFYQKVMTAVEQLPPAEPKNGVIEQIKWERDVAIEQLKKLGYGLGEKIRAENDCISRQAAIDRILATGYADQIKDNLLLILRLLPPAQPEIIRCKDCKHNPKYEWFGCPMSHLSEKQRPETAWWWQAVRRTVVRSD